jgi:hypothetical protein
MRKYRVSRIRRSENERSLIELYWDYIVEHVI